METDENFYKILLDNLYDGIYFVDRKRRILYWNKGAERLTGYKSSEVKGKRCADNILMHINEKGVVMCTSECPLAKALIDGRLREAELYLHHKNGQRIPVLIRVAPIYSDGKIIGAVEIFTDNSSNITFRKKLKDLERLALTDPLTGLANRRYIEMKLDIKLTEKRKHKSSFGVLFIDIDHFKRINDEFGHEVGDEILRMVANTLLANSRPFDIFGRWGGEEFVAIINDVNKDELCSIAERFRLFVEKSSIIKKDKVINVTVSIGATLAKKEDSMHSLIERADKLMYMSKKLGRNRVSFG